MSKLKNIPLILIALANFSGAIISLPAIAHDIYCSQSSIKSSSNLKRLRSLQPHECIPVSYMTNKFDRSIDSPLKSLNGVNLFTNYLGIDGDSIVPFGFPEVRMLRDARALWETYEIESEMQTNPIKMYTFDINNGFNDSLSKSN